MSHVLQALAKVPITMTVTKTLINTGVTIAGLLGLRNFCNYRVRGIYMMESNISWLRKLTLKM